ncbi:MAG: 4-hydroxy-tetrahydrodipicolinate synthase [Acidobacteria bacterium]|nr:4-hydroxy-tetrahydrodipicolinate synthase [Acidobacteriota bacterium]|tara:strand:+ start:982 stop:1881 length:900 start_codon:yes stop_codon:yes gene_type:complete
MTPNFSGCGTALVTPFTASGAVDEARMHVLTLRQIENGVNFLVPCGTTGENPTLSGAEQRKIVESVVETTAGRIPVLAGAGGYNTQTVTQLAADMQRAGADGILSVTPYYNKPTAEGLYQHYQAIADSVSLPIVVYNVPGRTGCNIDVDTVCRLAELPNIVGIKEASADMAQMSEICRSAPSGFSVLAGDDLFTLPLVAIGGHGVISVVSNEVPGEMSQLVSAALNGDFAEARRLHTKLLPLMQVNFIESNPIPVKAAMAHLGLLNPHYRLPMVTPKPASLEQIKRVLDALGLTPDARC